MCHFGLVYLVFLVAGDMTLVPAGAKLEKLWGDGAFTEGPAYGPGGFIYFTDIGNSMSSIPNKRAASVGRIVPPASL